MVRPLNYIIYIRKNLGRWQKCCHLNMEKEQRNCMDKSKMAKVLGTIQLLINCITILGVIIGDGELGKFKIVYHSGYKTIFEHVYWIN